MTRHFTVTYHDYACDTCGDSLCDRLAVSPLTFPLQHEAQETAFAAGWKANWSGEPGLCPTCEPLPEAL